MVEESRYCSEVMKNYYYQKPVMTKEDDEDFEKSTKCWICDSASVDGDVKVRHHRHITRKDRGSAHRGCNVNVKSNHNIPLLFHNLNNYDSHLFIQELSKFNF